MKTRVHAAMNRSEKEALLGACRIVAEELGITIKEPDLPLEHDDRLTVEELCAFNGVRCRQVDLSPGWSQGHSGPLLGFVENRQSGRITPTALLYRKGCYHTQPMTSVEPRAVDADYLETLEPYAYMFYRPFPFAPLHLGEIVRTALRGQTRSVTALLTAASGIGALSLALPIVTSRIVVMTIPSSDRSELSLLTAVLIVSALAVVTLELARELTVVRLKTSSSVALQGALWDRLLSLPASFFRGFTIGDLAQR